MVQLHFEDPPEYRFADNGNSLAVEKNADRDAMVALLPGYPNRWAIVSRHVSRIRANQVAARLRLRHNPSGGSGEFEFCARTRGQEGVVYGRYVAPDVNLEA